MNFRTHWWRFRIENKKQILLFWDEYVKEEEQ